MVTSAEGQLGLPGTAPSVRFVSVSQSASGSSQPALNSSATLRAFSDAAGGVQSFTVTTLPTLGSLYFQSSGQLVQVGVHFAAADATLSHNVSTSVTFSPGSFSYSATDGTDIGSSSDSLLSYSLPVASNISLRTTVDVPLPVRLSPGVGEDGAIPRTIISTLPQPFPSNPAVQCAWLFHVSHFTGATPS